jgi:hypothetical protein
MQPTTADAADERVSGDDEHGYRVVLDDITYHVLPSEALGWCVYAGENLDLVPVQSGGYATGGATAQEWIDILLNLA